jgi:hypothetical protein
MRKLTLALGVTAAMLLAGGLAWKADAMTWSSATSTLPAATKNFSPVERTACNGPGRWCRTGYVRRCGPFACRCVPCV